MTAAVLDPPEPHALELPAPEPSGRAATPTPEPDASDEELVRVVKEGLAARDVLVVRHKGLVYDLANKMHLPGPYDRDDIVQAGLIALAHALEKWNRTGA